MKKIGLITILLLVSFTIISQEKQTLSLRNCIDIAIKNNLNIKRSVLNLQTAAINLSQSKARRYPSLNANGGYGFNWGRGIDPTTNQFITQRINFNNIGISSNVSIIQGFQIRNGIKQAKLDLEATKKDLKKTENDVSLNTSQVYLDVIFNKELLENAKSQLESSQKQLDRTKKLVASGALPLSNELQLVSQVATNEVNLINSQNNLDLALLSLKQLLLLPVSQEIDVVIPNITIDQMEIENISIENLYNEALSFMPEIESSKLRVQSANIGVDVAKGGIYPTLSISGSIDTRYSDGAKNGKITNSTPTIKETNFQTASGEKILERTLDIERSLETISLSDQYGNNFSQGVSVSLRVPIFNGLQTKSQIQRSKIALQQANINNTEQQNILYQTIESSYRNTIAAVKTYIASQKQVTSLEETFRTVENQYNNGSINFTDYQVASNNLFQAKRDLSRAKYDFIFKQKLLDFYRQKPLTF